MIFKVILKYKELKDFIFYVFDMYSDEKKRYIS
jgi:hypothetical protein